MLQHLCINTNLAQLGRKNIEERIESPNKSLHEHRIVHGLFSWIQDLAFIYLWDVKQSCYRNSRLTAKRNVKPQSHMILRLRSEIYILTSFILVSYDFLQKSRSTEPAWLTVNLRTCKPVGNRFAPPLAVCTLALWHCISIAELKIAK